MNVHYFFSKLEQNKHPCWKCFKNTPSVVMVDVSPSLRICLCFEHANQLLTGLESALSTGDNYEQTI